MENQLTEIWLDEDLAPTGRPATVEVRLRGSYRSVDNLCVIWVGVFVNGTELRVYRFHNTVAQEHHRPDMRPRLLALNQNKIDGFITKWAGSSWNVLASRLVTWSRNPTYRAIILQQEWQSAADRRSGTSSTSVPANAP